MKSVSDTDTVQETIQDKLDEHDSLSIRNITSDKDSWIIYGEMVTPKPKNRSVLVTSSLSELSDTIGSKFEEGASMQSLHFFQDTWVAYFDGNKRDKSKRFAGASSDEEMLEELGTSKLALKHLVYGNNQWIMHFEGDLKNDVCWSFEEDVTIFMNIVKERFESRFPLTVCGKGNEKWFGYWQKKETKESMAYLFRSKRDSFFDSLNELFVKDTDDQSNSSVPTQGAPALTKLKATHRNFHFPAVPNPAALQTREKIMHLEKWVQKAEVTLSRVTEAQAKFLESVEETAKLNLEKETDRHQQKLQEKEEKHKERIAKEEARHTRMIAEENARHEKKMGEENARYQADIDQATLTHQEKSDRISETAQEQLISNSMDLSTYQHSLQSQKAELERLRATLKDETPQKSEPPVVQPPTFRKLGIQRRPSEHYCPITMEIMEDPVLAPDGMTYERSSIERWLQDHDTSPLTNEKIEKTIFPNISVRKMIEEFDEQNLFSEI